MKNKRKINEADHVKAALECVEYNKGCVPAEAFAPGEYIQEELTEHGLTHSNLMRVLKMNRMQVVDFLQGRTPVTPEIADRLAKLFGTSTRTWMILQAAYDRAKKG